MRRFRPDPGWAYNPGAVVQPPRPANPKLAQGQPGPKDYGRPEILTPGIGPRSRMPEILPRATSRREAYRAVNEELGLTGATTWRKLSTHGGPVALRRSQSWHFVEDPNAARERFAKSIIPTLKDPDEVWLAKYGGGEVRMHYVRVWRREDGASAGSFAVAAENDRLGNLVITFFPARQLNAKRTGWLVYHRKDEG